MSQVELNDIIALKNGKDYTVINIKEKDKKLYFLLACIDNNEKPDLNDLKIAEEIEKSGKKFVKEIDDEEKLKGLEILFKDTIIELKK